MIQIFNNKNALLSQKPRKLWILIIVIFSLFLGLLLFTCQVEVYDNYLTKGVVKCSDKCLITSFIPYDLEVTKIALNNKNIDYNILSKNLKIDEENYLSYYEISLTVNEELEDNEIIELNFYYNKQRIISKILQKMF